MRPSAIAACLLAFACVPTVARANPGWAPPPDRVDDRWDRAPWAEPPHPADVPRSIVRIFTGPVLRVSDEPARGGLGLAIDAGSRGAGARFAGQWIRAGSASGAAQYGAELWIDFADEEAFHPILAAGAAVARLDHRAADRIVTDSVGVGVLRATLQYRLPVPRVDARAALDVTGAVPAVGLRAGDYSPWATASITVGVGF